MSDAREKTYSVTRDGEVLVSGLTHNDAFAWILQHQGQSVDWAMKHEGYSIVPEMVVRTVGDYLEGGLPHE